MKRTAIIEIIIFLYSILLLYTGISKLLDYSEFKDQIAASPILAPIARPIALGLPWMELAVILLLIIPRWRLKGLFASLVLMILFTGYVIGVLAFNDKLPCSCGGIIQQLSWPQHIIFNGAFIILAIWGIVLQQKEIKEIRKQWLHTTYNELGIRAKSV